MPREDDVLETHTWGTWVVVADGAPICVLAGPPPTEDQVAMAAAANGGADKLCRLLPIPPVILTRALGR